MVTIRCIPSRMRMWLVLYGVWCSIFLGKGDEMRLMPSPRCRAQTSSSAWISFYDFTHTCPAKLPIWVFGYRTTSLCLDIIISTCTCSYLNTLTPLGTTYHSNASNYSRTFAANGCVVCYALTWAQTAQAWCYRHVISMAYTFLLIFLSIMFA